MKSLTDKLIDYCIDGSNQNNKDTMVSDIADAYLKVYREKIRITMKLSTVVLGLAAAIVVIVAAIVQMVGGGF